MTAPTIICVVPVKNESWILKNFIESAQQWADLIIIADHDSRDNSAEIASKYKKVKVVSIADPSLDRGRRRKLLIDEARKVPGKRLIFTIDADELISSNWRESSEWQAMLNSPPGTQFEFDWIEIFPATLEGSAVFCQTAAFIDDDTDYANRGTEIHESRLPRTSGPKIKLNEIKLLHCDNIDPDRMISKHRWYKCVEYIELGKRPWALCIMYQDTKLKTYYTDIFPLDEKWLSSYPWLKEYISASNNNGRHYWYDEDVLDYFDRYGVYRFRKLNIWEVDWNRKAGLLGRNGKYDDPRSRSEVWVHEFIKKYREELKIKQEIKWKAVRLFGKTVLRALGW